MESNANQCNPGSAGHPGPDGHPLFFIHFIFGFCRDTAALRNATHEAENDWLFFILFIPFIFFIFYFNYTTIN